MASMMLSVSPPAKVSSSSPSSSEMSTLPMEQSSSTERKVATTSERLCPAS